MEKLQQDVKAMVDNVPVPAFKLNQAVKIALEDGKKQKRRPFIWRQQLAAGIASIFILGIGALLYTAYLPATKENGPFRPGLDSSGPSTSGTQAMEPIPYSESIFYKLNFVGLKRMAEEGRVQNLSQEAKDSGITVFLEEGYLDNHQLALSYRLEYDKTLNREIKDYTVSWELLVDGKSQGLIGNSGMDMKDFFKDGRALTFDKTKGIPDNPLLEVKIHMINGIEGDWSFKFNLKKEKEFITKSAFGDKTDEAGNSFSINNVELTPSKLKFNATTNLSENVSLPENSSLELYVYPVGTDGKMYLPINLRRSSNSAQAYGPDSQARNITETVELPREVNTYSYKVIPAIATYTIDDSPDEKGKLKLVSAPFSEGVNLNKMTVKDINEENDETIVSFEVGEETGIPSFPWLTDQENRAITYAPLYFKKLDGKFEVAYPRISSPESLEFTMFDAKYKSMAGLESQIDLK